MMTETAARYTLYGAPHSGAVAVEAVLTLLGLPYDVIDGETWHDEAARDRVQGVNPRRQVPTLILPGGEVMTESAAILIGLADAHPAARLAPPLGDSRRFQFLRWMMFVSSAIYALYWIKGDVARVGVSEADEDRTIDAVHDAISKNWALMDEAVSPAPFILGAELTVLDLYVAVISTFGPWRERFYETAPKLAAVVRRVDAEPRLATLWRTRLLRDD
ncbi:hypothetical protein sos41_08900 [Alphaproteobacteria bacterium SO-S41]|nr:hypothetical protein sos41_08900 [Alphaproteobacteria bacterium SO-S41]